MYFSSQAKDGPVSLENSPERCHTSQKVGPSWQMEQLQEAPLDDFKD